MDKDIATIYISELPAATNNFTSYPPTPILLPQSLIIESRAIKKQNRKEANTPAPVLPTATLRIYQ
jgi:hypothetical protein